MPVLQYSLEYKVPGLPWEEAVVVDTNKTYMLFLKYADTYIYEVRVSARNMFWIWVSNGGYESLFRRYMNH